MDHIPFRDRRIRPRFDVVGELWGRLETVTTLHVQNIGRGGALLESPMALPLDSVHRVVIAIGEEQTQTEIRVRHTRRVSAPGDPQTYLIGVEFLGLSGRASQVVDQWIAGQGGPLRS